MRLVVGLLTLSVVACSGSRRAPMSEDGYPCGPVTYAVTVTPTTLVRGEATMVAVTWRLDDEVDAPRATLAKGDVDLVLPLVDATDEATDEVTYKGALLNPFGAGMSPGTMSVLVEAEPWAGCAYAASATASMELQ